MQSHDSREQRDPRVSLAAERTLLAWIRTGLALMGLGFVVARFGLFLREVAAVELHPPPKHVHLSLAAGVVLVVIGVMVNVVSGIGHARFIDRFNKGLPLRARRLSLGVVVAALMAAFGAALAIYLVATR